MGLVAFSPPGPALSPSTNHAAVKDALVKIIGSADASRWSLRLRNVSVAESIDIDARDEFSDQGRDRSGVRGLRGQDLAGVRTQDVLAEARRRSHLRDVTGGPIGQGPAGCRRRAGQVPERKTLVLISAGMPTSDRFGGNLD